MLSICCQCPLVLSQCQSVSDTGLLLSLMLLPVLKIAPMLVSCALLLRSAVSLDDCLMLVCLALDIPSPYPIFGELPYLLEPRFENLTPLCHVPSKFRSLGLGHIGVLVLVLESKDAK